MLQFNQELWFSTDTDLSLYNIPGYLMISTEHYASNHGGLAIYFIRNGIMFSRLVTRSQNIGRDK